MCRWYLILRQPSSLRESIFFVKGKFLNHKSVHPYRTREVEVLDAQHALIGIDGRLMNTPVGSFSYCNSGGYQLPDTRITNMPVINEMYQEKRIM